MRKPDYNMDYVRLQLDQAASSICCINPKIESVIIDAVPTFHVKREDFSIHTIYHPSNNYRLTIKCPNINCDCHYIDLSDEVFDAIKFETVKEGRKRCLGHLNKYNHNKSSAFDCEAYVDYTIKPIVKNK